MRRAVIEIRYRAPWRRAMLTAAVVVGAGGPRWLRWALTPESAAALERAWATHVVSCGAAAAIVNLAWSRGIAARAIHVMQPPWPLGRRFALRLVPHHDRAHEDKNTIVTHGALHGIQPAAVAEAATRHRPRWALRRPRQIGVLVGGNGRDTRLPADLVAAVIDQALTAAETLDAELLLTTSRRTAPAVERWLQDRLAGHPRCAGLVIARRDPTDGVVPAIIGLSSALVVSGDSMSMVSEAAASDKPLLVFEPRARSPQPKFRRLLSALAETGRLEVVAPGQLAPRLVAAVREARRVTPLDDRAHALARLRAWL